MQPLPLRRLSKPQTQLCTDSIESYSQPGSSDPAQQGEQRTNLDVRISEYDLAHTYFPGWEQTIKEGKALGVMCTFPLAWSRCCC